MGIGRDVWRRFRPPPPDDFKTDARVLIDIARQRLQNQLAFGDALDNKIGMMFAAGSALLGLLGVVFALQEGQSRLPDESVFGIPEVTIGGLALFFYIVVTVAGVAGLWIRDWKLGPSVEDERVAILTEPTDVFMARVIDGYIQYIRDNSPINDIKRRALGVSYTAVTLETLCVVAAVWRIIA